MFTNEQILKLKSLYACLKSDNYLEAEELFLQLNLTSPTEYLSHPKELRNLIFKLHEFLVVGDHVHVTDKETILRRFKVLFPEIIA